MLLPGILSAVPERKLKQLLPKWALSLLIRYLPKQTILLVGGLGSDRWKYNNGGGKIQQAAQLGVKILPETAISGLLKEAQNV